MPTEQNIIVTRILDRLVLEKGNTEDDFHAFDLTPEMLENFRHWMSVHSAEQIELIQADLMDTEKVSAHWKKYDLIVC